MGLITFCLGASIGLCFHLSPSRPKLHYLVQPMFLSASLQNFTHRPKHKSLSSLAAASTTISGDAPTYLSGRTKITQYISISSSSFQEKKGKKKMGSSNFRDTLTSFSPTMDLFAVSAGDGRIKIWDTVKGQLQTEFSDIASTETSIFGKQEEGHLSMDYTCMKWLSLGKKKKRKLCGGSLLVLGTGGGDVMALDVSAGQLKWRVNNCHPGGVTAVSSPLHGSHVYTAGADGMVCEIDSITGNLLNKLSATSRAIFSVAVSPDGNMIATAAAQLKIFNSSNNKKLQKFSGHPGPVRCMVFSEDGKYVLSSASGERYIAVWKIDSSKTKSSCALLAMDHPAVFLDTQCGNSGNVEKDGLSVLAIAETGVCYFWHGKTIDELRDSKPTKIHVACDDEFLKKSKGSVPNVLAAKLQSISEPAVAQVFFAHGFLIKPTFEKVTVKSGRDVELSVSRDGGGVLLPAIQSPKTKKSSGIHSQVTALDSSNTEGALLPVPNMFGPNDVKSETKTLASKDESALDSVTICMEDRLRSLGLLSNNDDMLSEALDSKKFKGINLDVNTPHKKVKATVSSMKPSDAFSLLNGLVDVWQSRSHSVKHVLPWIYCILMYHHDYVKSEKPKLLDFLYKVAKSKESAINPLFQLSGRLQLVSAQIEKASNIKGTALELDQQEDESEDEDVDEVVYGVDDEDSQMGTDSDD